jgi:hypothetical protein
MQKSNSQIIFKVWRNIHLSKYIHEELLESIKDNHLKSKVFVININYKTENFINVT